jgi:uncharacterized protein (UPF0332 family)
MINSPDFLSNAEALLHAHGSTDEAMRRTIASRAYYAIFHTCRETVHRLGLPYFADATGGSHLKEYKAMEACSTHHCTDSAKVRALAYRCKLNLRPLREKADYCLSDTFTEHDVQQMVASAKTILREAPLIA